MKLNRDDKQLLTNDGLIIFILLGKRISCRPIVATQQLVTHAYRLIQAHSLHQKFEHFEFIHRQTESQTDDRLTPATTVSVSKKGLKSETVY